MPNENKHMKTAAATPATPATPRGPIAEGSPLHRLLELAAREVAKGLRQDADATNSSRAGGRRR